MNKTNEQLLKPYIGYIGSKSSIADALIRSMPPEAFESYCEVFAGGLGLFLKKKKARIQNILNDLDPDVIGMHETVAGQPYAVMKELGKLRPSRKAFEQLRDLRDSAAWMVLSPSARAARTIYLMKCSVNSNMTSFSISSKVKSNYNHKLNLLPYSKKFDGVTFEKLDWRKLLHRLVFKPEETSIYMYIDPPYVVADTAKHYRYNFDATEHLLLARELARVNALNDGKRRNVKVMLSYDDDPEGLIRALYRHEFGWFVQTIPVKYTSENGSKPREELLITNYEPMISSEDSAVRDEIPKIRKLRQTGSAKVQLPLNMEKTNDYDQDLQGID